jgi:acetyl-CoA C-acetyltransferase
MKQERWTWADFFGLMHCSASGSVRTYSDCLLGSCTALQGCAAPNCGQECAETAKGGTQRCSVRSLWSPGCARRLGILGVRSRLGAQVVREALPRAQVAGEEVGHVAFGNVIHTEARDMYLARVAAVNAGVSHNSPALTLNRLCGSGLQAIVSAAQSILLGDTDIAIGAGAESVSRAAYIAPGMRWGTRMGEAMMTDMMLAALHDPFHNIHMGETAENLAESHQITRAQQDALAVESHRRAARAIREGRFAVQIHPVKLKSRKGEVVFDTDEHVRADASAEELDKLRPVFRKNGTVTAGNASGANDGAAAVVLMEGRTAEKRNAKPIGRLVAYAHAGVDPKVMGIGPVPATRAVLERARLRLSDMDVIEANEAFAAQACAVAKDLGFDPEKTNPNGSGISLGHPVGATGTRSRRSTSLLGPAAGTHW